MGAIGRILVTGAAGFLGDAVVTEARRDGMEVVALVRPERNLPAAWQDDPGIILRRVDLSDPESEAALAAILQGVDTVIHAAAASSGSDADHARDTIGATGNLIRALVSRKRKTGVSPRLILISSFSVYGYASLPDHVTLDEHTPVEPDPALRDAYCRAKLGQEALSIRAAQEEGISVRLIRPGAIHGPGRVWTARLGFPLAGWVICPGGDALVPAIHVANCARALLQAARRPLGPNDIPAVRGGGALDIVNLVDPVPPTQRDWLRAIGCRKVICLPLAPVLRLARALDVLAGLLPDLDRRLPAGLRAPALAARFKPLSYSTARAEDRLGCVSARPFSESMQESQRTEETGAAP